MKKNFKARAKTLRRKMSECAFDQSGDGPSAEALLTKALEKVFNEGMNEGRLDGILACGVDAFKKGNK